MSLPHRPGHAVPEVEGKANEPFTEKTPGSDDGQAGTRRKSSVVNPEVLTGEIFDQRYESTQRGLKSRHCQMIALGGTIGTGLFVGSGQTLARGGPAFIVSAFVGIDIARDADLEF